MEELAQNPEHKALADLHFLMIVLLMLNLVFYIIREPQFEKTFGPQGQWVFALLAPPIQYYLQRFFYLLSVRIGLRLFASDRLSQDPLERGKQLHALKTIYPATLYPALIISLWSWALGSLFLANLLAFVGFYYMLSLSMHAVRTLYKVSPRTALFAPLFVQFLLGLLVYMVVIITTFAIAFLSLAF
jgi:hypothetical protein